MKMQRIFLFFFSLYFVLSFFLAAVNAGHDSTENFSGPSFTDSSVKVVMTEEWLNKPIHYDPANKDADIVITLDGQMFLAWEPLIQKFGKDNNLKIVINRGTCGFSAGGLLSKSIDIGAFCCPPGETDRLPDLDYHTVGIAALALLVHPDNPVDNISFEQARQIFRGDIYKWSDVDGSKKYNHLIKPVARLHCKIRPGHWRLLLDNKDMFTPDLFEVGAMPDMINQVMVSPGAIGHEVLWMARYYSNGGKYKFLKVNGYSPDNASHVVSTRYPLYRVYSFTTWKGKNTENHNARKLVDYIMRNAGHLDSKYHLIPYSDLRKAGWKFRDSELTGGPG